jgi:integrase
MRKPQVRYFASRQGYYCQHRGRQHKLASGPDDAPTGPTYLVALAEFRNLLSGEADGIDGNKTVVSVWDAFQAFLVGYRSATTLRFRSQAWKPFVARFGSMAVSKLTHTLVYAWLADMRRPRKHKKGYMVSWDDGTVRNAVDGLHAGLNWSVKSGLIAKNPLKGMEKPSARSRGEEAIVEPQDHQKMLAKTKGSLREFIIVLDATGARPGEIAYATAANYDSTRDAIVYRAKPKKGEKVHKTARKSGKDRVIYLTGEALEIVKRRCQEHPTGPIFGRKAKDGPGSVLQVWTDDDVAQLFRRASRRAGVKLTAYSYRHTFATRWLLSGRSVEMLAELLGNSPAVIMKHYSHLARFSGNLRAELEAFRQGTRSTTDNSNGSALSTS